MKIFLTNDEATSLGVYLTAREAFDQAKKNTDGRLVAIADEHLRGKDIGLLNREDLLSFALEV